MLYIDRLGLYDNESDELLTEVEFKYSTRDKSQFLTFLLVNHLCCFRHFTIDHEMVNNGKRYAVLDPKSYNSANIVGLKGRVRKGPRDFNRNINAIAVYTIKTKDATLDLEFALEDKDNIMFLSMLVPNAVGEKRIVNTRYYLKIRDKDGTFNWHHVTSLERPRVSLDVSVITRDNLPADTVVDKNGKLYDQHSEVLKPYVDHDSTIVNVDEDKIEEGFNEIENALNKLNGGDNLESV